MIDSNQFVKKCYIKFNNGAHSTVVYEDSVERANEYIIEYVKESYPKGSVQTVMIVEK